MKNSIDNLIVVGDRVLIKPDEAADRTKSGLFLPAGYQEKEQIQQGFIMKVGPGYAIPSMDPEDEAWNGRRNEVRYLPLQVKEGDKALFMQKNAIEIKYEGEKYYIVPQSAILLVERVDFD